jgi:DNA replication and repair protein RecF
MVGFFSIAPVAVVYLQRLHLRQFRNYAEQWVEFVAPKTILVGDNAQGKSNLLEAVELLATLRSHRTSRDGDLVRSAQDCAQITGWIDRAAGPLELSLSLRRVGRRTLVRSGETLRRQLDGLGSLNAVEFSSLDLDLVRGGPEQRRRWLDGLVMQLEPIYAHLLRQYERVLRQRNALLRDWAKQRRQGQALSDRAAELAVWDAQLAATGTRLIRRRARAIARLAPLASRWHGAISGRVETLTITYAPNVAIVPDVWQLPALEEARAIEATLLAQMRDRAEIEQYQGTSLVGPHRDEVTLAVDDAPAKQYGSQGQQRTLVLALKLAELCAIEAVVGEPPLLLLDDVLAELDLARQNQLLGAIADRFQTIVTTTHLGAFDARWLDSAQVLTVRSGEIVA